MQFLFNLDEIDKLSKCLNLFINKDTNKQLVFICIGTDKVIGDSFGPIVGQMLSEKYKNVYGTLYENVNAINFEEVVNKIKNKHSNPYIVVIDSALGDEKIVNKIVVGQGGIKPGSAVDKDLSIIGDMYINAVVGKYCASNFIELKNAKMYNVYKLTNIVFSSIDKVMCLNDKTFVNNHIRIGG